LIGSSQKISIKLLETPKIDTYIVTCWGTNWQFEEHVENPLGT